MKRERAEAENWREREQRLTEEDWRQQANKKDAATKKNEPEGPENSTHTSRGRKSDGWSQKENRRKKETEKEREKAEDGIESQVHGLELNVGRIVCEAEAQQKREQ